MRRTPSGEPPSCLPRFVRSCASPWSPPSDVGWRAWMIACAWLGRREADPRKWRARARSGAECRCGRLAPSGAVAPSALACAGLTEGDIVAARAVSVGLGWRVILPPKRGWHGVSGQSAGRYQDCSWVGSPMPSAIADRMSPSRRDIVRVPPVERPGKRSALGRACARRAGCSGRGALASS
jgi:hypothetical protein